MTFLLEQLQPASFRGVPFFVRGAGVEVGRRIVLHEYPQRNKPWAEDLGRAARGFTVDAFVVGPDYVAAAQALMKAAEEEGAGTLVHPWFGSLEVTLRQVLRVQFDASAGQAMVTFDFVEPGDLEFPTAQASTPMQSRMAADGLCTAASEDFASGFEVDGWASFVRDLAALDLRAALDFAGQLGSLASLSGWSSLLSGFADEALSLFGDPLALAQQIMDWFDLSDAVAALAVTSGDAAPSYAGAVDAASGRDPLAGIALAIVRLAGNGGAGGVLGAPVPSATATPARRQQVGNTAAINAVVRRALLAQAVGMSSYVDTTVQADAYAVRDVLCSALDAESLVAADASYEALQAARRAVWTDITARASSGARLVLYTPAEVCPALVIAYERYEDATRADEIVSRNGLVHPGFVPSLPLQVLSK